MRTRERRRAEIRAQLEHIDGLGRAGDVGRSTDLLRTLRGRLTDWQGYLTRQPDVARQTLRKLLEGRLILMPRKDERGRYYEVTGRATYGRLLEGIVSVGGLVPPEWFARFC